jgi:hypothetical protein
VSKAVLISEVFCIAMPFFLSSDEMALDDFIVDITGKVAQNIEKIQHLFKVDEFNN